MLHNVLLIDDSQAIHSLLKARLKDEPIQILSATSGQQGLELATSLLPDLILLDVDMPEPNGFEVCRQLKSNEKLNNIPVVFLTGAASSEQKVRGLEMGGWDYITKPFDPAEVRARVRAALRMKFMMDLLAQKAQIDALTGLWNRRYFDQRFEAELSLAKRAPRPLSVLMIDLDLFKKINDSLGHPAGDEVLKRVGALLAESIRMEDVLCRYGGEEFAIISPNIATGAPVLGERLRAKVSALAIRLAGQSVPVTISVGVGCCANQPSHQLLEQAIRALNTAKQNGRNRVEVIENTCPQPVAA